MASVSSAARSPFLATVSSRLKPEQRGSSFWMDRVLTELDTVRNSPDPDAVHDLRVAIRRCRSLAAVLQEVDPDPAWRELRKVARKLFRGLGSLRDAQVMEEWVKKLGPPGDPLRTQLLTSLEANEGMLQDEALRMAAKFDQKTWKRLERHLRQRARLVPPGSLAAECLALERFEQAKDRHAQALRSEKPKPRHALRIALKRFRYTSEALLPDHYAVWNEELKRLQDLLGEIHDLDVLSEAVRESSPREPFVPVDSWEEKIASERHERMETYRRLTLGKTSLWNKWRHELPHGERLQAAGMARLRATARAADPHARRTSQVMRIARALFDALRRLNAAPEFRDTAMHRALLAAARLHGIVVGGNRRSPQKAAKKFLLSLPIPPGWTTEDWELLAWTVRYHRGAEPKIRGASSGGLAKLPEAQQKAVLGLAGVLRMARALRKCGIARVSWLRGEQTQDALILRIPGLPDSAETASYLAAGKHLLETFLEKPLLLKPAVKWEEVLALPVRRVEQAAPASAASD